MRGAGGFAVAGAGDSTFVTHWRRDLAEVVALDGGQPAEHATWRLADSVVELAPDNAEAWNRRAFIHYSAKDFRAAVGDLRRALALDKNHFKALDGLASIFQQIGEDAKALKVYEQLRDIHPFWPGLDKTYEKLKGKVQGRGI